MTHNYKIQGITCSKCVQKVKNTLENIPGIEKAEVSLSSQTAVITMNRHVQTEIMNKALADAGNYSLTEDENAQHEMAHADEKNKPFLAAYKPILLVFGYLAGISVLNEFYHGTFDIMRWMHLFMGGFFLVFSFFKMLDLKGFAYSYMSYDIIAKRWPGWGYIYPFIELALGLAYLFHFKVYYTSIITAAVMGVSSIGVIQSIASKRRFQCACLGTVFKLPMSSITLTEDLLMVLMAAAMLII